MRRPAVRSLAGLLVLMAAGAGPAAGQAVRGRLRAPPPPPAPAEAPSPAANTVGGVDALAQAPPARAQADGTKPVLRPAAAPPPTLRSAVQSRWSRPAEVSRSVAGQCRAQCAIQRQACAGGEGDTSGCDPGWTQCLSICSGLSYRRGGVQP